MDGNVKPVLKWVGGKTQILGKIIELFPKEMMNYHEPFLGGGSVLLRFLASVELGNTAIYGTVYASDLNPNLIALYKNLQSRPDEFIQETRALIDTFSKCTGTVVNRKPTTMAEATTSSESYYYWIRSWFNALKGVERETPAASAMMLFLNKTCFRGVYRENSEGGFNVPYGNYKRVSIMEEAHIREVSRLISGVVFTCCGFSTALRAVCEHDFVYLDPPYAPENDTSFVSYTADGFGLDAHKELFLLCANMGAQMLMSNADVPLVTNTFAGSAFTTKKISCRRAIHSKRPNSRTTEVLIQK
uniref:site-specific DNA-methyltransferase (adenine-specific) n=1 Tax=viral metagenome TaxID=1070528 RepID=A0A6C0K580_9ZZZZ